MTDRQLHVCALALFDDGWPTEAIAKALGVSREVASDVLTMGIGFDADLVWQRHAVKDKDGLIIVRNEAGEIVERLKPS